MDIRFYPDPVLTRRAEPVEDARIPGLGEFVDGMLAAMKAANGVGLAGPQVGEGVRIFVATDTADPEAALVCINPKVQGFGKVVEMEEGCLSVPGIHAMISRPESVRMTWTDLDGEEHSGEFHELMARILQHENDHLDGVLFIDRMTAADRIRVRPDLQSLEEQYRPR